MTDDTLRRQFAYEVAGAKAILSATARDRPAVYAKVYDGFYSQFGDVPHASGADSTRAQLAFIGHFVKGSNLTFVEFGPGRCGLLLEMAKRVRQVIGIEASAVATTVDGAPNNLSIVVAPEGAWDLPNSSVDVVYSNQVLEHLHPEDCRAVLTESLRVLKPGGRLLALTPSSLTGPHDISRHVTDYPEYPVAAGLHLIEYDSGGLIALVSDVGFKSLELFIGSNSNGLRVPAAIGPWLDRALKLLPRAVRLGKFGRGLAGIRLAAVKPA